MKIPKNRKDKAIEFAALILLLFMWINVISALSDLPEIIPSHFDIHGKANSHGSKYTLVVLPIVATALFVFLQILTKFPHKFNFPYKITERNAYVSYKLSVLFLRILNLALIFTMFFISNETVNAARNPSYQVHIILMILLPSGILALAIYFIVKLGTINKKIG